MSENLRRAERAAAVLEEYEFETEGECAVIDLLTDLRHLCLFNRYDFDRLTETAEGHFEEEK